MMATLKRNLSKHKERILLGANISLFIFAFESWKSALICVQNFFILDQYRKKEEGNESRGL